MVGSPSCNPSEQVCLKEAALAPYSGIYISTTCCTSSQEAYADDVTLTQSYEPQEATAITAQLNYNLSRIIIAAAWRGNKWRQVRFASQKTQAAAAI